MGDGDSQTMVIAQHVDVGGFARATLVVRFHSGAIPDGCAVQFDVYSDGYTPEDPAVEFFGGTALGSTSWTASGNDITTPQLGTVDLVSGAMGSRVVVKMTATQASPADADFTIVVSANLVLKYC